MPMVRVSKGGTNVKALITWTCEDNSRCQIVAYDFINEMTYISPEGATSANFTTPLFTATASPGSAGGNNTLTLTENCEIYAGCSRPVSQFAYKGNGTGNVTSLAGLTRFYADVTYTIILM